MTDQDASIRPPRWADALLAALLPARDRASVTGDLLEEYRESVAPVCGKAAADRWYLRQAASLVLPHHAGWALLFAMILVARSAIDAFAPTHDYSTRGVITTYVAVTFWLFAGFASGWRTDSLRGAVLGGALTAVLACLLVYAGTAILVSAIVSTGNHAAGASIQSSGGADEMFLLPALAVLPAVGLATLGSAAALLTRRVHRTR